MHGSHARLARSGFESRVLSSDIYYPDGSVTTQWKYDEMWDQHFEALVRSHLLIVRKINIGLGSMVQRLQPRMSPWLLASLLWRVWEYLLPPYHQERSLGLHLLSTVCSGISIRCWRKRLPELSIHWRLMMPGSLSLTKSRSNLLPIWEVMMSPETSSVLFLKLMEQNSVDFRVNMRWGVEDLVSHVTSSLSMTFNDLGARWSIRYVGHQVRGGTRTLT